MFFNVHKTESDFANLIRLVCYELENANEDHSLQGISEIFNNVIKEDDAVWNVVGLSPDDVYQEIYSMLADFFIPENIESTLRKLFLSASDARNKIQTLREQGIVFLPTDVITLYLDAYYDLISYLYLNHDCLKSNDSSYKIILDKVLNVDIEFEGNDKGATFYSPIVLDGMNHLYKTMQGYRKKVSGITNEQVLCNHREVIISKVLRLFRWKLVHNGEIMQAALPAYVCPNTSNRILEIPIRSFSLYNSYDGIGELRLLDKVLFEIDRYIDKKKKNNYVPSEINLNVALFGDVNEVPLIDFLRVMSSNLINDKKYKKIKFLIKFNVYTKNDFYEKSYKYPSDSNELSYNVITYDGQLKNRSEIDKIISSNDIVFILDSCDIYKPYEVRMPSMTDKIAYFATYDKYVDYLRRTTYGDLRKEDSFHDMMRQMYVCLYSGSFGYFRKELNFGLIDYVKQVYEKYDSNENPKTIYIYASDSEAFDSMFFNEEWFARVERYHEKQIAIMRVSRNEEKHLALGEPNDMPIIVFTLWQFIKHMAIRNIKCLEELFGVNEDDIYLFKEMKVGIDYKNWPEKLQFYYDLPEKLNVNQNTKTNFIQYLEDVIMPIFGHHEVDMYYDYFVKATSSFLYSDVKNVSDMLFLHLFVNRHSLLGKTVCDVAYFDLEAHRPNNCKYSQKRYYEYIMKDYDTSSENFYRKYDKLQLLSQGGFDLQEEIFTNIKTACERNSYTQSYLYQRCKEKCS